MGSNSMKQVQHYEGVWSRPARETVDYPGFCVHDGRVSGSITAGESRLPLWCLIYETVHDGFAAVEKDRADTHGLTADSFSGFLYDLLEMRGEFGRLLCVLANAERVEGVRGQTPWWLRDSQRRKVIAQLRRCLETLEVAAR